MLPSPNMGSKYILLLFVTITLPHLVEGNLNVIYHWEEQENRYKLMKHLPNVRMN